MASKIILRQETEDDFKEVFELNYIAFGQENEAKLVDALRKNQTAFIPELSIVAIDNNKIVGHILFTKIGIKDEEGKLNESLGLAPMAVRPEFQKSGIGGQLVSKGLEVAKELGFNSVIVLGHEHYYPKFGFKPADKWKIKAPFEVPANVFMAIELTPDGLRDVSGTVVYPKEFETV
ncbi:MAG: GNAT family N-acetyltransferase [Nitritalea sp.]